jgi:transposase-like protein
MPGRRPKRSVDEMDLHSPQREAAMFYGLFLKGHSLDSIREEIDISPTTFRKWMKAREYDQRFRTDLQQMYQYRKRVLAIFNSFVTNETGYEAWQ